MKRQDIAFILDGHYEQQTLRKKRGQHPLPASISFCRNGAEQHKTTTFVGSSVNSMTKRDDHDAIRTTFCFLRIEWKPAKKIPFFP